MAHSDVTVNIKLSSESGTSGFGYPLIFTGKLTTGYDYTECSSLEEVKAVAGDNSAAYNAAKLIWMQNNPPRMIAVYGSTEKCTAALPAILNKGWRHLIVTSLATEGEDTTEAIASYIETTKKAFYFSTTKYENTVKYKRSIGLYYADDFTTPSTPTSSIANPEAALVGAVAGKPAGSVNFKNLILVGLTPLDMDTATLTTVHENGLITVLQKSGDIVTSNGKTTDGKTYCDLLDTEDWIILELIYRTQKAMNKADKIPYDNVGIAFLENICVGVMKEACTMGIVAALTDDEGNITGYDYNVRYAPRNETTKAERDARRYTRGTFRVTAAGAVDTCDINGVIEI